MAFPNLCDGCISLARWLSAQPQDTHSEEFCHPKSLLTMVRWRLTCVLCDLLPLPIQGHFAREDKEVRFRVEKNHDALISELAILVPNGPIMNRFNAIDVWTTIGDAAYIEGKFSVTSPPTSYRGPETIHSVERWINRCRESHSKCRESIVSEIIDEDTSPIPATRLLDVGKKDSPIVNHCWGPPEKQPPRVTLQTQGEYAQGVLAKDLPKTFSDAIEFTRALGIQYIWIDSLCIIQDSKEDWEYESAKMGAIYEGAFLRIAASGSKDPSGGLFDFYEHDPEYSSIIKLPFFNRGGDQAGNIHLRLKRTFKLTENLDDPADGPLRRRAWAFQEARLARRTVSFMPGSLTWKCNKDLRDERDCVPSSHREKYENWSEWMTNVAAFSEGELTYETDRLIAIQGLANAIAKTRSDEYINGVWMGEIPKLLLWRIKNASEGMKGLRHLPTWNWAHHAGVKSFCWDFFYRPPSKEKVCSTLVKWSTDGTLTFSGSLVRCSLRRAEYTGLVNVKESSHPEIILGSIPECFFIIQSDFNASYLLWENDDREPLPTGMVALDNDEIYENLYYSIMLVGERKIHHYQSEWETRTFPPYEAPMSEEESLFWVSDIMYKNRPSAEAKKELFETNKDTPKFYWILLLQPTPVPDTFRRVGMGILTPSECIESHQSEQIFYLV